MATIREWLKEAGFNWKDGIIIMQEVDRDSQDAAGWVDPIGAHLINWDNPILDKAFYAGYGLPECPRFIAKDDKAIYFPAQYDGATWIETVYLDINKYLNWRDNVTPYPGN